MTKVLVAFLAGLLLPTVAADLSGCWTLTLDADFSGNASTVDCTFKQDRTSSSWIAALPVDPWSHVVASPAMDTHPALIEALERAPAIVVPLVREVPPSGVKQRPVSNKWSAHEHACHLAVVHRLFFDRLDQMLASPSPLITSYDPGQSDPDDMLLGMDLEKSLNHSVFIMFRHVALQDFFHAYRIEELLLKKEWTAEWNGFAAGPGA